MDWWVSLLVIVVLGVMAALWWRNSGRTPENRERGEHRPGSQSQYKNLFPGP